MAIELATAYVSLSTSAKGLRKEIDKELGAAGVDAGKKAGGGFGDSLKKWGKRGAVLAGGAVAAGLGVALTKGLGRLTAIENAQAKLKGLGHDAGAVDKIMSNALASVKGTAFGLGEAATTAAGAVAAGIKPGKDLEAVLKSTANSAAAAGVGMDEMGAIYNKVASLGKAQNDSLQQVADKGIPIYQALAEQLGVTTDEVFKLASEGKVSFEDFEKAMTQASGTVAEEMGQTLTGSLQNAWAAIGRLGASLLGGVFDSLGPAVQGATGWIDKMGPAAERVGDAIGSALGWAAEQVGTLVQQFKDGEGAGGRIRDVLSGIGDVVKTAFGWVQDNAVPAIKDFVQGFRDGEGPGGKLRDVLSGIGDVASQVFTDLRDNLLPPVKEFIQQFRDGEGAGGAFRDVVSGIGEKVKDAFGYVADNVVPALEDMYQWVKDNKDTLIVLGSAVVGYKVGVIAAEVATKAITAATKIWTAVQKGLNLVMKMNPIGLVVAAITALIAIVVLAYNENETFRKIVDTAWAKIKEVISGVVTWVKETAWPWMRDAFQNMADKAGDIKDKIVGAWDSLRSGISAGWDKIKGIFDKFKEGLSSLREKFSSVRDGIGRAWSALGGLIARPINAVIDTVNGFLSKVSAALNKIPGVNVGDWGGIPHVPVPSASSGGSGGGGRAVLAMADGGTVPGWSPHARADNIIARLTAGEFVLPVKATARIAQKIGRGGLEWLRRGMPGYADGGPVGGALDKAWDWVSGLWDKGADWVSSLFKRLMPDFGGSWPGIMAKGALSNLNWESIASALKELALKALGGSGADSRVVGGQRVNYGGAYGWAPSGPGVAAMVSMLKAIDPSARVTSGYRPGSITASGIPSLHSLGRAIDIVSPDKMATFMKLLAAVGSSASQLYYTPAKGLQIGYRDSAVAAMHHDHIHWGYADGGLVKPLLFDRGGYLPPGTSLVHNATGAPEPLGRFDQPLDLSDRTLDRLARQLDAHARRVSVRTVHDHALDVMRGAR